MNSVVLTDAVRTPFGAPGGSLNRLASHDLAAAALAALARRSPFLPDALEHVVMGQAMPTTMPSNIARYAPLMLRWPESIPALTVNMGDASGMQALRSAYYMISGGQARAAIAGGADSFSAMPFVMRDVRFGFEPQNRVIHDTVCESETRTQPEPLTRADKAQALAEREGISQAAQEQYAALSRERAAAAAELMRGHIAPAAYTDRKRGEVVIDSDEYIGGAAGTLAPNADGASAALLMDGALARELGLKPAVRITGFAVAGCAPARPDEALPLAVARLLSRRGVTARDVGCVELHEESAAAAISARDRLCGMGVAASINPYGGALATGRSCGGDGAAMLLRLALAMRESGARRGVAAATAAGGLGIALLCESYDEEA